jgi:lipoprotein-releasing system ATP-binding protein
MADLVVEQLSKSYPTPGDPLVVLQDVSLEMSLGDNLAIVGPSGSGKSTLLHIIGTLDRPTSGHVRLQEQDPFQLSDRELARFRNQRVGFVFQDHHLLPQLTAWENVLVPTLADGSSSGEVVERAEQLLARVGLANRRNHRPAELSGGERQRVAVARALIHAPRLLMADEPTGNLDPRTADSIADLLLELQHNALTPTMMIVVTHSQRLAGRMMARRELVEGRLS